MLHIPLLVTWNIKLTTRNIRFNWRIPTLTRCLWTHQQEDDTTLTTAWGSSEFFDQYQKVKKWTAGQLSAQVCIENRWSSESLLTFKTPAEKKLRRGFKIMNASFPPRQTWTHTAYKVKHQQRDKGHHSLTTPEVWTRVKWLGLESDLNHKIDDYSLHLTKSNINS